MTIREDLLALEHQFWRAAGDGDFYREHMAEDGLCLLSVGMMDRDETAAAIDVADPWEDHHFDEVALVDHGAESATLCYMAEGRRAGEETYRAVISSTYDRLGDEWYLRLHQQTPLAH